MFTAVFATMAGYTIAGTLNSITQSWQASSEAERIFQNIDASKIDESINRVCRAETYLIGFGKTCRHDAMAKVLFTKISELSSGKERVEVVSKIINYLCNPQELCSEADFARYGQVREYYRIYNNLLNFCEDLNEEIDRLESSLNEISEIASEVNCTVDDDEDSQGICTAGEADYFMASPQELSFRTRLLALRRVKEKANIYVKKCAIVLKNIDNVKSDKTLYPMEVQDWNELVKLRRRVGNLQEMYLNSNMLFRELQNLIYQPVGDESSTIPLPKATNPSISDFSPSSGGSGNNKKEGEDSEVRDVVRDYAISIGKSIAAYACSKVTGTSNSQAEQFLEQTLELTEEYIKNYAENPDLVNETIRVTLKVKDIGQQWKNLDSGVDHLMNNLQLEDYGGDPMDHWRALKNGVRIPEDSQESDNSTDSSYSIGTVLNNAERIGYNKDLIREVSSDPSIPKFKY